MPDNTPPAALRVGTFNLAHGKPGAGFDTACDQLAALNLDVIFLQEVERHSVMAPLTDQVEAIARSCNMNHTVFAPAQSSWLTALPLVRPRMRKLGGWGSGVGIVSKYPLRERRLFPLESTQALIHRRRSWFSMDQPRQVAAAVLDSPVGEITVASTHLSFRDKAGREQILQIVREFEGERRFLLGADLNRGKNVLPWPSLATGLTFPAENPTKQIDWIVGTAEPEGETEVVRLAVSDHCGLVTTVRMAELP